MCVIKYRPSITIDHIGLLEQSFLRIGEFTQPTLLLGRCTDLHATQPAGDKGFQLIAGAQPRSFYAGKRSGAPLSRDHFRRSIAYQVLNLKLPHNARRFGEIAGRRFSSAQGAGVTQPNALSLKIYHILAFRRRFSEGARSSRGFSRAQARVKLSARYAFGHAPLRSCSDTALLRAVLEAAPFFRATILQLFEVTS